MTSVATLANKVKDISLDSCSVEQKDLQRTDGCLKARRSTTMKYLLNKMLHENVQNGRTAFIYDEAMAKHRNIFFKDHIERPGRILRPYQMLTEEGILQRCDILQSRKATEEELLSLHSDEHVQEMAALHNKTPEELFKRAEEFRSIYLCQETYECACLSAGCTLELLDHVLSGKADNGFALVRPPGHHAEHDQPMGFCYFNNVALAAHIARAKYGIQRVLIVDWDIHFGNGTQTMFQEDPNVLYFSIHRFDIWPFLPSGDADEVGKGKGEGYTIHVPWIKGGMGDGDYLAAFNMVLMPIAYEFNPELVLVSCGFDSGLGDPRGQCRVTPECYAHLTNMLLGLAGGKVLIVLEGGYNLSTVSYSTLSTLRSLLGEPCPQLEIALPCESGLKSILRTLNYHKPYWKCLQWIEIATCLGLFQVKEEEKSNAVKESEATAIQSGMKRQPVQELPLLELPVLELPVLELPVLELPVLELPVLELLVLELLVLELPVLELPVLELPVLELLVLELPVLELPVRELPVLEFLVLELPPLKI